MWVWARKNTTFKAGKKHPLKMAFNEKFKMREKSEKNFRRYQKTQFFFLWYPCESIENISSFNYIDALLLYAENGEGIL